MYILSKRVVCVIYKNVAYKNFTPKYSDIYFTQLIEFDFNFNLFSTVKIRNCVLPATFNEAYSMFEDFMITRFFLKKRRHNKALHSGTNRHTATVDYSSCLTSLDTSQKKD